MAPYRGRNSYSQSTSKSWLLKLLATCLLWNVIEKNHLMDLILNSRQKQNFTYIWFLSMRQKVAKSFSVQPITQHWRNRESLFLSSNSVRCVDSFIPFQSNNLMFNYKFYVYSFKRVYLLIARWGSSRQDFCGRCIPRRWRVPNHSRRISSSWADSLRDEVGLESNRKRPVKLKSFEICRWSKNFSLN